MFTVHSSIISREEEKYKSVDFILFSPSTSGQVIFQLPGVLPSQFQIDVRRSLCTRTFWPDQRRSPAGPLSVTGIQREVSEESNIFLPGININTIEICQTTSLLSFYNSINNFFFIHSFYCNSPSYSASQEKCFRPLSLREIKIFTSKLFRISVQTFDLLREFGVEQPAERGGGTDGVIPENLLSLLK